MRSDKLIEKIKASFEGVNMNKDILSSHANPVCIGAYPAMRNKDRGFDISIIVECKGSDFEHVSDVIATNARSRFLLVLSNCQYSHEQGLYWAKKTGGYKVISDLFSPNVIVSNNGAGLNSAELGMLFEGGLSVGEDVELARYIAEKALASLTETAQEEVFNIMLACKQIQTKDRVAS